MVRYNLITAVSAMVMGAGGFGFGWINAPETGAYKLAQISAGLDWRVIPVHILPADTRIVGCVWVWTSKPLPEVWCPPPKPPEAAVPTS